MSKKAKNEVDEKSAAIITDAVLAENDKKLKDLSASIQNALKRKHKIIMDCKLYTYDKLSQLYGGAEGRTSRCCDCGTYADRQADHRRYDL